MKPRISFYDDSEYIPFEDIVEEKEYLDEDDQMDRERDLRDNDYTETIEL